MIRARLRHLDQWHDACILNLSNRGIMLQTATPPRRGAYVEIRKASHLVIGRVVWSRGHRLGLRSQDIIAVDQFISGTEAPPAPRANGERRAAPRPRPTAERSAQTSRTLQFVARSCAGAAGAVAVLTMVEAALAEPMTALRAALSIGG